MTLTLTEISRVFSRYIEMVPMSAQRRKKLPTRVLRLFSRTIEMVRCWLGDERSELVINLQSWSTGYLVFSRASPALPINYSTPLFDFKVVEI